MVVVKPDDMYIGNMYDKEDDKVTITFTAAGPMYSDPSRTL